jgi:glycosyltransferase involved in cell wall biosynthesis
MIYRINKKKKVVLLNKPKASIIVTCKGRLHHLQQTIPYLISQICDFNYEIIVVDYGDPDGCFEWCKSKSFPKVKSIKVLDNVEIFNLARARNCGAKIATGEIFCFVDADIIIKEGWLADVVSKASDNKLVRRVGNRSIGGTCAVPARIYYLVRGYNEALCNGWGHEENDFYSRCKHFCHETKYNINNISYINHSEHESTKFCCAKKRGESSKLNKEAARKSYFLVNPDGYGVCRYELYKSQE